MGRGGWGSEQHSRVLREALRFVGFGRGVQGRGCLGHVGESIERWGILSSVGESESPTPCGSPEDSTEDCFGLHGRCDASSPQGDKICTNNSKPGPFKPRHSSERRQAFVRRRGWGAMPPRAPQRLAVVEGLCWQVVKGGHLYHSVPVLLGGLVVEFALPVSGSLSC